MNLRRSRSLRSLTCAAFVNGSLCKVPQSWSRHRLATPSQSASRPTVVPSPCLPWYARSVVLFSTGRASAARVACFAALWAEAGYGPRPPRCAALPLRSALPSPSAPQGGAPVSKKPAQILGRLFYPACFLGSARVTRCCPQVYSPFL